RYWREWFIHPIELDLGEHQAREAPLETVDLPAPDFKSQLLESNVTGQFEELGALSRWNRHLDFTPDQSAAGLYRQEEVTVTAANPNRRPVTGEVTLYDPLRRHSPQQALVGRAAEESSFDLGRST